MHLLIDIGNSTIVVAISQNGNDITNTWRFKTMKSEDISFFRRELRAGFEKFGVTPSQFSAITISSVVPEINDKVSLAIIDVTGVTPHFFTLSDAKKLINIDVESPSQLGKDRIADAIGATVFHGYPCIVIDMGTATTIGVVNKDRCFIGGMIIPGVKTSLKALSSKASQLPVINIEEPRHIIGRDTVECMQSGILYGNASMIDGIVDRILPTLSSDESYTDVKIVATGGMANQIIPYCQHSITIDPSLQLKGLMASYRK